MKRIGPGTEDDIPVGIVISADKGYGDVPPPLTPLRARQLRRVNRNQERQARTFNQKLFKCRVIDEHIVKHMKTYQVTRSLWHHPRWFQPVVVELCTFFERVDMLYYFSCACF